VVRTKATWAALETGTFEGARAGLRGAKTSSNASFRGAAVRTPRSGWAFRAAVARQPLLARSLFAKVQTDFESSTAFWTALRGPRANRNIRQYLWGRSASLQVEGGGGREPGQPPGAGRKRFPRSWSDAGAAGWARKRAGSS